LGKYVAGIGENSFYLHIPASLEAKFTIAGVKVGLLVEGNYPWSGKYTVRVDPERPVRFAFNLRIPEWADEVSTDFPNANEEASYNEGYACFDRVWSAGDVLKVDLGTQPKWVESDPRVRDNLGRTALTYGPIIYCAEDKDLGYAPQLFSADTEAEVSSASDFRLGGVTTLTVKGMAEVESFVDGLYAEAGSTESRETTAKFIPYYAWNNRGPSHMQVWVRKL
jgi:DUF1680 family protein